MAFYNSTQTGNLFGDYNRTATLGGVLDEFGSRTSVLSTTGKEVYLNKFIGGAVVVWKAGSGHYGSTSDPTPTTNTNAPYAFMCFENI